jgi:hypothetical protein
LRKIVPIKAGLLSFCGLKVVVMYTALVVCNGPLLYDFTIVYKGSLDGTVLVFVIATGEVNTAYPFLKCGRNFRANF